MAQTYPMDKIIRLVDDRTHSRGSAEVVVLIDTKLRTVLPKPPLITTFRSLRYYLVGNTNDPRNSSQGEIAGYVLQSLEHNVPVTMTYVARCRPGNEGRVALALFDDSEAPGEILERKLTRWLTEIGQADIPAFVRDYLEDRTALEARIIAKALAETGLDLSLRLFLEAERSLNPLVVTKEHLRATALDYHDEEQDLGFRITIDVSDAHKLNAMLYYRRNPQLQELVPREVLRFVRQSVTMQMYCTELNSAAVRGALTAHLDAFLASYGRKVGTIRLDARPCGLEFFFQYAHDVTCELREYPKPVVIQNKVQMILRDVALYKSVKSPDLKQWLEQKLDRSIRQCLFNAKYIEVLVRFHVFEAEIKRVLDAEAKAIGYQIEQIITTPDLEPIRWKDPFPLEVSGTFETQASRFYVNVQFVVTARIPRLETVEPYLNREQNVPKLMEDAILAASRRLLHSVNPERFYMRFYSTEIPDERSVKDALVTAIDEKLREQFGADVIEVVIKVVETDLIARLKKLMETICPFVVEMISIHGDDPLIFHGNFQTQGVDPDGWHRFQLLTIGVEEIRRLLEEHLLAQLHTATPDELKYRSPEHRQFLERVLSKYATDYIREEFGLIVRITNVYREPTPGELQASRSLIERRERTFEIDRATLRDWAAGEISSSEHRLERLGALLEKRNKLAMGTDVEDDLAELDRQIAEARAAMAPSEVRPVGDIRRELLPPPPANATLRDLARLAGMPDPTPKQLEGERE
ncbi:MAG TPA: hypothetical protein VLC46_15885 [Thermoanaerobaculia bacterium]|jgi:hypothetical protein|nr:hypothetical protein [Thermoanaerobaculia bacterium]